MKAKHIKLTVDLWLRTDTKGNENCLDKIGYEIIQEYLSVRRDEQSRDEEDFEAQNGYIIEDYEVDIVKEKKVDYEIKMVRTSFQRKIKNGRNKIYSQKR